ncbi:unnamed protein product [Adineta ricciae]|uniref:Apple domain-containing protein n=1 Tax=Adineta ricciae TaxID=249248 RepID=A0A813NKD1_ADIRI|nr:unnamed protein product [Adineta ricciae]
MSLISSVLSTLLRLKPLAPPTLIQCQSGTFLPLTGRLDAFKYDTVDWMISELGCISICLRQSSPSCNAVCYENFRQECRMIRQSIPSNPYLNQSLHNWRTYIRIEDS